MTESLLLGLLDNATIFVKTTDPASSGFDPDTGNDNVSYITVEYRVTLEEDEKPRRDDRSEQPPGGVNASLYVGNCCAPASIPATVPLDGWYPCEFDSDDGAKITGRFKFVPTTQAPELIRLGLNDLQGQSIRGWFVPNTN